MNGYLDGMRRYFTFRGRSTRSQYWLFLLFVGIFLLAGMVLDSAILNSKEPSAFSAIVYLVHAIPALSLSVRRLHDADKSGWLVLLLFVPLLNIIICLMIAFVPSTAGINRFGEPVGQPPLQSPVAPAVAPTPIIADTTVERLEKLASLRASGAIDEDEFKRMKAELMGQAS